MKLLIVLSRIPYPLDKGDKLRAYHQIKQLIEMGNEVVICCLHFEKKDDAAVAHLTALGGKWHFISLSKWRAAFRIILNLFRNIPFQVTLFHCSKAQSEINDIIQNFQPHHLFAQLVRTSEYLKNQLAYKKSIDFMDALGAGLQRRAQRSQPFLKMILLEESERMQRYENIIWNYFDSHFIISKQDGSLMRTPPRPTIQILPNGIDTSYYQRCHPQLGNKIVFTGNMSYPPNVDAALFLIHEIMPLVWELMPELRLMIAGTNPHASLLREKSSRIEITGRVDDIRVCYEQAALFVAPMRMGTGMQNKILEALSMAIPVITTPMAASAFQPDVLQKLMVAESAKDIANSILKHYQPDTASDGELRNLVVQHYNWKNIMESFIQTIHEKK